MADSVIMVLCEEACPVDDVVGKADVRYIRGRVRGIATRGLSDPKEEK